MHAGQKSTDVDVYTVLVVRILPPGLENRAADLRACLYPAPRGDGAQLQEGHELKLYHWYTQRGPAYILQRAATLRERYGITPAKAIRRVMNCVTMLAEHGCAPTFPTPGRVVQTHPDSLRLLQKSGAEIAVHGFDHVDVRAYPLEKGCQQLVRATRAFDRHGIEWRGFRCPYLGCPEELPAYLPPGLFDYSSNQAIEWDASLPDNAVVNQAVHEVLKRVYRPRSSRDAVSVPWSQAGLVEIPVNLPDDLTLHDAHQLGPDGLAEAWIRVLRATHERGEMFVLMYHPELGEPCHRAFAAILDEAARLRPGVWLARLRDISHWWREKDAFDVSVSSADATLHVSFSCSERATILVKGLAADNSEPPWDGVYRQLRARSLEVPAEPRPFLGLAANAPPHRVAFLREQGYILDTGDTAPRCATYLDATALYGLASDVDLITLIEASPGPLIRYWRWPNGARSALSITGDLDAVSLLDYAARLFVR